MLKKILRKLNLTYEKIITPYYWFPYYFRAGKAYPPKKITLEITYNCDLNCIMCPLANWKQNNSDSINKNQNDELNIHDIKSLVDDLKIMNTKSILLTGGEPLLNNDFLPMVRYIKKNNLYCSILTNGSIMNEEIANELIKNQVDVISISIDGPKTVHNKIRGSKVSYQNIIKAAKILDNVKKKFNSEKPEIIFNCTISQMNYKVLPELVDVAESVNVKNIDFMYLFFTTSSQEESINDLIQRDNLKPEDQNIPDFLRDIDFNKFYDSLDHLNIKATKKKINISFIPPLKNHEIKDRFLDESNSYCNKCFYPWYSTRISPSGVVYPCSININMGNIRKNSILNIWNNKKYRQFRKKLKKNKLFPTCMKCCALKYKYWSYI